MILKVVFALFACCAIGVGLAIGMTRAKSPAAQFYMWLGAVLLFISIGVLL